MRRISHAKNQLYSSARFEDISLDSLECVEYRMQIISSAVMIVLEIFDRPVRHKLYFRMRKYQIMHLGKIIHKRPTSDTVFVF